MKMRMVLLCSMSSLCSTIQATKPFNPGTSLWLIVNQTQDIVHEANALVDSLAQTIVAIDHKEDELTTLIDYIARESARRIELVFDQAEEIRAIADSKLDAVIDYVQYVERLSTRNNTGTHQAQQQGFFMIDSTHITALGGFIITQPGHYKLAESVSVLNGMGISIHADNVLLDFNGQTLTGSSATGPLLMINQSKTVVVKNGTLVGGQGLFVTDSEGIILEGLQIVYTLTSGIELRNTNEFCVAACTVRNSSENGIVVDAQSSNGIIQKTVITDCIYSGFVSGGSRVLIEDSNIQHNGIHGISIQGGNDVQVLRNNVEANSMNGIIIDIPSSRIQVNSCRVLGNGAIGCVDGGATQAIWCNNLSSGNTVDDYNDGIRAVSLAKATSYWHNVYGN